MAESYSQGNVPWWTNPQRILLAKILNAIGGGGGGSSGGVTCGAGAPVAAPVSGCGMYVDTSTGAIYTYYSGAWH